MNDDIAGYKHFSQRMKGSIATLEQAAAQTAAQNGADGRLHPVADSEALGAAALLNQAANGLPGRGPGSYPHLQTSIDLANQTGHSAQMGEFFIEKSSRGHSPDEIRNTNSESDTTGYFQRLSTLNANH